MNHGNQYVSRKRFLLDYLRYARYCIDARMVEGARIYLAAYQRDYALVPASTRRRWKCGR